MRFRAAPPPSGEAWRMPGGGGAALYLISGAVFPVSVLPPVLRTLAQGVPLTWWLEAMRRGLLPPGAVTSFPQMTDRQVLGWFAVLAAVGMVLGWTAFTLAERRARERGVLDRESAF